MINNLRIKALILIFFLFHSTGYSYIDPGSLSAVWQFLAAIFIGLVSGFSFIRIKIKELFYKIFKKKKDSNNDSL